MYMGAKKCQGAKVPVLVVQGFELTRCSQEMYVSFFGLQRSHCKKTHGPIFGTVSQAPHHVLHNANICECYRCTKKIKKQMQTDCI